MARAANFPVSLGFCISDYTSQGSTFRKALLDLGQPHGRHKLALMNVYVMLSRVPGKHAVRLLRLLSFQDFCGLRVKRDLLHEMGRLERLEAATLQTYDAPGAV